jgi:hypothetical protein
MKDVKKLPHLSISKWLIIISINHVRQQCLGENMLSVRNYIQLQGTAALIWTMRKTYTGINRGKNSRKPSGGMLTSQYADLKGLTVRTLVENLGNIKRLLILNHKN